MGWTHLPYRFCIYATAMTVKNTLVFTAHTFSMTVPYI